MVRSLGRNNAVVIAYAAALLLFVGTSIASPGFASANNIGTLLAQTSFIALAALGQTYVIVGGGIDLSLPAVMTTAAVILTKLAGGADAGGIWWVVPLILGCAAVVGIANGVGVAFLKISPIVMTLATQSVVTGLLLVATKGASGDNVPDAVTTLANTRVLSIPIEVFLWAAIAVLAVFVLRRTTYGRRLYAVGSNPVVAELSGVNVRRVTVIAYVTSSICAAVAGILFAGYVGQAYLSLGDPFLFPAIAAVAIGGASILGGTGSYVGTVAGALVLAILGAMLPLLDLKTAWLSIVYGLVILAAVGLGGIQLSNRAAPAD
jgi:ribose transport system permease protein